MARTELDWSVIRADLVVGTGPRTPEELEHLHKVARATALLSLQHDTCHRALDIRYGALRRHAASIGLALERVPMRDFDSADMRRQLPLAVHALHRLLTGGHRVYVHCTAGVGRAPLTVMAYLALVEGQPPQAAYALLCARRPAVIPIWDAFRGCVADLAGECHEHIDRRVRQLRHEGALSATEALRERARADVLRERLCAGR